jgi:hypothetical protein
MGVCSWGMLPAHPCLTGGWNVGVWVGGGWGWGGGVVQSSLQEIVESGLQKITGSCQI